MYTTLQDKLQKLKRGDNLPLDMLRELVDANPEWRFYRPGKSPGGNGIQLQPMLGKVTSWQFEKWTEVSQEKGRKVYHEGKATIFFSDGTKGTIHLDQSNFYRLDVLGARYKNVYFKLMKTGRFAYAAEEEIYGLYDYELIMEGAQEHSTQGLRLPEGEPVMVLQTLMLGDVPLVKFLHGEDIRWTYGVLFDKDHFDEHHNDNHWL